MAVAHSHLYQEKEEAKYSLNLGDQLNVSVDAGAIHDDSYDTCHYFQQLQQFPLEESTIFPSGGTFKSLFP